MRKRHLIVSFHIFRVFPEKTDDPVDLDNLELVVNPELWDWLDQKEPKEAQDQMENLENPELLENL